MIKRRDSIAAWFCSIHTHTMMIWAYRISRPDGSQRRRPDLDYCPKCKREQFASLRVVDPQ